MVNLEFAEIIENIELARRIEKIKNIAGSRDVVFLCVGNSQIWYDSFGPMMGTLLQCFGVNNYVYGNIRANINQSNIEGYIDSIYKFHYNPYIVVFDNALSSEDEFDIKIKEGHTECACLSDNSVVVGDLSILCLSPIKKINNSKYYVDMLRVVKKLALYLKEFYL